MKNIGGYFDIHTHILPGVDDGASDIEQTRKMLQIAASEQITTIIATPHYICGKDNPHPEYLKKLKDEVENVAYGISKDFRIFLGNEIFYSESVIDDLKQGKALTLAESNYVLVEFPVSVKYSALYRAAGELIRNGYFPILAHIERYICLNRKPGLVEELIEAGCYIQVNCSSIMGSVLNLDAAYIRKLINMGLVHFLGSDCHNDVKRAPVMKNAVKYLANRCDKEITEKILFDNPLRMLENNYI